MATSHFPLPMRGISLAITTIFLLSPLCALAAYGTPAELLSALQSGKPRSFSVTAHANLPQETYVTVWANGAMQGLDPTDMQLQTKVTLDIVARDFKGRMKGELKALDGVMYVKIDSLNGSMQSTFGSLSTNMKEGTWLQVPVDPRIFDIIRNPILSTFDVGTTHPDATFNLTTLEGKGSTTYTLTMKPDAAATLAQSVLELIQDTVATSDDFFPWKSLAESTHFTMTVRSDYQGTFVGSSYDVSTRGGASSFTLSGTEKPAASLSLTAPTDARSLQDVLMMFASDIASYIDFPLSGSMMMEQGTPSLDSDTMVDGTAYPFATFDSVDSGDPTSSTSCNDPSTDSLKILMLQRTGECPVEKTPTRYTR